MKTGNTWIIISLKTKQAFYGIEQSTLRFSTEEIAVEVANQLFRNEKEYIVVCIPELQRIA